MTIAMPSAREPFFDPATGQVSRFWYRYLSDMRGSGGSSVQDLTALTALFAELSAMVNEIHVPRQIDYSTVIDELLNELNTTRSSNKELQTQIDELRNESNTARSDNKEIQTQIDELRNAMQYSSSNDFRERIDTIEARLN